MSLVSALIFVEAENDKESLTPSFQGGIRAWFIEQVANHDAELAQALESQGDIPLPFSLSPIMRDEDKRHYIRICSLWEPLSIELSENILTQLPVRAEWDDMPVCIKGYQLENHPEAGTSSYVSLFENALNQAPANRFSLRFITPTGFKQRGLVNLFPLPRLVYASLLRRWEFFSELKTDVDIDFLESQLVTSSYHLNTRTTDSSYASKGFTGRIHWRFLHDKNSSKSNWEYHARFLQALTAYAFYAGLGYHTSLGLGQVRPIY